MRTQPRAIKNVCLWSRRRIERLDESGVEDLVALVVGHTPVGRPTRLGNVYYIDTGGWYPDEGGYFTLLDLNTLMPVAQGHPDEPPERAMFHHAIRDHAGPLSQRS
ncbi:hypothetical protein [Aeromonas salmonicida]|uniref:hypothetical protein n=1 Tax=Aeromonas salmonicida TaxID=645 RepID=UPI003D1CA86A